MKSFEVVGKVLFWLFVIAMFIGAEPSDDFATPIKQSLMALFQ